MRSKNNLQNFTLTCGLPLQQKYIIMEKNFQSLKDFYPYYLAEHQKTPTRVLHFLGTLFVIALLTFFIVTGHFFLLILMPVVGYGFAWVSHLYFERNKPATFKYPLYSLASDFVLFWHLLTGQERF